MYQWLKYRKMNIRFTTDYGEIVSNKIAVKIDKQTQTPRTMKEQKNSKRENQCITLYYLQFLEYFVFL